ncbi:hypothetical protein FACS189464_1700 [Bacteroidia bacterium]|nr:hypothetical protein FACS189464_1700 [Bacteroidia bacterium]
MVSKKSKRGTTSKRRSYKRRNKKGGLAGLPTGKLNAKNATESLLDVGLTIGGAIAASKGIGFLAGKLDPDGTSKMKGMLAPGIATVAGLAGTMMSDGHVKSIAKGVALGGAVKLVEKAMGKENLLGLGDDGEGDNRPLALPGIGLLADLPELPRYSENADADVATTGGDPRYYMGQPNEVLSGDEEFIAV